MGRFESKSQKHSYDLDLHDSAELFVVMKLFAFLGLLVVLSQVTFATEDGARLLVRKRVLNQEVVLERETFVQIDIFNVGPGDAYDVRLEDSWEGDVLVPHDFSNAKWDRVKAHDNVSFSNVYIYSRIRMISYESFVY